MITGHPPAALNDPGRARVSVRHSRRTFLALVAGATVGCRQGVAGLAGAATGQPLKKSLHFGTSTESAFFSSVKPTLTLVGADGSVTEIVWDNTEMSRSQPQGVSRVIAVSAGELAPTKEGTLAVGRQGRIAVRDDGGLAFWATPGEKAVLVDAAAVRRAFDGRTVRQCENDGVLLSDGTIDTSLMERLNGQKLTRGAVMRDGQPLTGVRGIKGNIALCDDGRIFGIVLGEAVNSALNIGDRIVDACFVVNAQVRAGAIAIVQGGAIRTQGDNKSIVTLDGPKDAARIEGGMRSVAVMTQGGAVFEINIDGRRKQPPFAVRGLAHVIDIALYDEWGLGAALRSDGSVWLWRLDRPEGDAQLQKIAEHIAVPDAL